MSPNGVKNVAKETDYELPLQRGKMMMQRWEIGQEKGTFVTLLIAIKNHDGSCWTIRATRFENKDGSSTEVNYTVEDEHEMKILLPADKLRNMDEFVTYCFFYKGDEMLPYEWGSLVSAMNETRAAVMKVATPLAERGR